MKLVSAGPLVLDAQARGYAVPAFNTNGGSYEIARAAFAAAQELRTPLILQVYEPNAAYRGLRYVANLVRFLAQDLAIAVPFALHLDHGRSLASVTAAIEAGFTSVMFDGSHDPLETNIARTRQVLDLAHGRGVSVEAEVGCVRGNEPAPVVAVGQVPVPERPAGPGARTDVDEAARFLREAPVDMLAVAVGTVHGVYGRQDDIDYALLERLRRTLAVPLVQHGTCGIGLADLARLARSGMAKINFGEPFRYNYIRYFLELSEGMQHAWHPWRIQQEIEKRLIADMKEIIRALGAEGKADGLRLGTVQQ